MIVNGFTRLSTFSVIRAGILVDASILKVKIVCVRAGNAGKLLESTARLL